MLDELSLSLLAGVVVHSDVGEHQDSFVGTNGPDELLTRLLGAAYCCHLHSQATDGRVENVSGQIKKVRPK